ncbi:hypothetical protein [Enterobacter mori]|uniref:hypothetical protein n=1 Tax=Enterobacter mori TaxID=539813 RepID=UPI003B83FEF2
MKWDRVALIVLDDEDTDSPVIHDPIIADDVRYYIERYNIPSHLVIRVNHPSLMSLYNWKAMLVKGARAGQFGVLAGKIGGQSKIIIVGHSAPPPRITCSGLDAVLMSRLLKLLGVTDTGLISFKSCHTGAGTYLEDFTKACAHTNIRFGWCLAYTAMASLTWTDLDTGKKKSFGRQIIGEENDPDYLRFCATSGTEKAADEHRIRVIRGVLTLPEEFKRTLGPRFNR